MNLPHQHSKASEILTEHMPELEEFSIISDIFGLLADSTRIRLFWILCHIEECVVNLSAMMKMSSPALSHHLKLLKTAGLAVSRREGKEVYYKAASTPQADILHEMIESMAEISCP